MRSKPRSPVMPPTRFVDDYLAALLAQASALISSEFHAVARAAGVPVAEWRILASLAGGEPLPVGRLAQLVIAPQPTVTRQLDRMVKKGLVERMAHESDRRLALVRTTPAGEALGRRLVARAQAHEREVLAPFADADAAELKAMLRTMIRLHGPAGSAAIPADMAKHAPAGRNVDVPATRTATSSPDAAAEPAAAPARRAGGRAAAD